MKKLKPCPFCGEDNVLISKSDEGWRYGLRVVCWCGSTGTIVYSDEFDESLGDEEQYKNAKKRVIEAWNTRSDTWISVEDRLPDEKGVYLVSYHPCHWDSVSEEIRVGTDSFRGKSTWAKNKRQRIVAWTPLPDAPREEK